ncbi:nucleoside hydrolase [Aquibium sp. ELW1220]|uniref:nucleoside hydrolase n=1 Tax=Aquibium sp. ELW1220 TaxID=2976766 RepID=UPI0025B0ED78|nr:nucleoside hydrolase [Aquibium sp. ELW1220]MDN2582869.1 nucleoside hydrolase [Aquibium sp. ELW1220]
MSSRATIIDTDPGIDDAVAILAALASPEFDVLGITTVAGNIGIATTTRNAGRILALVGRGDVPVIPGAAGPLSRKGFDVADIHGYDGLGGVGFPEPATPPRSAHAANWLADTLKARPAGSVDILALGPLTNIAQLLVDEPESAHRVGRIIAMGGAIREPGNIGPRSEFNMAADPEAAEAVLAAGLPLTLIPLDVTRKVRADRAYVEGLRGAGTAASRASADLIAAYFQTTTGGESRPLHDPCVMLMALAPRLFGCEDMALSVDCGETRDAGSLEPASDARRPFSVALTVDGGGALSLLAARLTQR